MSFKRWQCPTCNRVTRSVTSVRERYCVACSAWAQLIEHHDDAPPLRIELTSVLDDPDRALAILAHAEADRVEARIRAYAEANGSRDEPDGKVWN